MKQMCVREQISDYIKREFWKKALTLDTYMEIHSGTTQSVGNITVPIVFFIRMEINGEINPRTQ